MNTLYMSSENNKTSDPHRLALNLADEKYLKSCDKYISLSNLSMYYTSKNNNGSKISAPTCNDKFELRDGSYSVSDIEDYFVDIIKNMKYRLTTCQ